MSATTYQGLESHLITWGSKDEKIRAIIIIGSRGRFPPPDAYADLDIILFTLQPKTLTNDGHWLTAFAKPWISSLNYTGHGDPELVVIFEDGLKLDVVISKAHKEDNLIDLLTDSPYTQVFRRGYRILLDRSRSKEPEIHACDLSSLIPSLETFSGTFDNALIAITRAAKFNMRDDLWRAQHTLGEIRRAALQFIEWHTLLCNESQVDFWYDGRDLNSWAEATINEKVPGLFATYGQKEINNSLGVALEIINRLSLEVAHRLDFPFPNKGQTELVTWLNEFIEKK